MRTGLEKREADVRVDTGCGGGQSRVILGFGSGGPRDAPSYSLLCGS